MAELRVFISSTCYDLSLLRSQLRTFTKNMGYEPIMSDYEDILHKTLRFYVCGFSSPSLRPQKKRGFASLCVVGVTGFEPTASWSRTNTPSFFDYFC